MIEATADPLLAALASLREIDGDYAAAHPETVDAELEARMRNLRLVITAISELERRGEPATDDAVREEMRLLRFEFTFLLPDLLELEHGFREAGDTVNADTLRNAAVWMNRARE